jgi:hypothetical protein
MLEVIWQHMHRYFLDYRHLLSDIFHYYAWWEINSLWYSLNSSLRHVFHDEISRSTQSSLDVLDDLDHALQALDSVQFSHSSKDIHLHYLAQSTSITNYHGNQTRNVQSLPTLIEFRKCQNSSKISLIFCCE